MKRQLFITLRQPHAVTALGEPRVITRAIFVDEPGILGPGILPVHRKSFVCFTCEVRTRFVTQLKNRAIVITGATTTIAAKHEIVADSH